MYKIESRIKQIEQNYNTRIQLVTGLYHSQKDVVKMIEYYGSSKYLKGQTDERDKEKPFFQILNGVCDTENAAKDIDTKDITATSDDGNHYTQSFILTKDIYQWMKETNFAKTLNDMRDAHTRYGSLLVKRVKKDGKLSIEIPEWKNVITDQVDIINNPIVEIHWMTPSQVLRMTEWKNTDKAVKKALKENKRIPVYEVRGEFPLSCFKDIEGEDTTDEDDKTFTRQLYYLAGEPAEFSEGYELTKMTPLYWENDVEQDYKYLARKRKAGRDFGVGVFEEGEQAQIWTNDTVLKQARAMEYTTKVVAQSASKKLKGRNLLSETDDGTILEHEDGKPITNLQLGPSGGIAQFQTLIEQWYSQLQKTTSAYDAQRGETSPSGTPFRLQALILQQSNSVFKTLQEELGIFVTEIFEDWVMPELSKQLNKAHILAHEFSIDELKEIDKNFSTYTANQQAKEMMLSNQVVTPEMYEQMFSGAKDMIGQTKTKRFLDVPKDYYKGMKSHITVNVTGEQVNKAAVLESLSNIMLTYAKNPAIAQDPVLMQIFLKIVELSGAGISPVSLVGAIEEAKKQQEAKQAQEQAQAQTQAQTPQGGAPTAPQGLSLMANPLPMQ